VHPAIIALIIVAAIGLGILGYRQDQKRRRLLFHWARSRGLARSSDSTRGWEKRFPRLKVFGRGHSRRSTLTLTGEVDGRPVTCLDYRFTTGSGKNQTTHRRAMVIVETGHPVIPLQIRREHVFDKVGEFLGHDDIDFESAEFSRAFHVSSSDRKWAYDVIHTRTMEYLMGAPHFTIAFGMGELAVYKNGRLHAADCQAALKVAHTMLEMIPDFALEKLKGGNA